MARWRVSVEQNAKNSKGFVFSARRHAMRASVCGSVQRANALEVRSSDAMDYGLAIAQKKATGARGREVVKEFVMRRG